MEPPRWIWRVTPPALSANHWRQGTRHLSQRKNFVEEGIGGPVVAVAEIEIEGLDHLPHGGPLADVAGSDQRSGRRQIAEAQFRVQPHRPILSS